MTVMVTDAPSTSKNALKGERSEEGRETHFAQRHAREALINKKLFSEP